MIREILWRNQGQVLTPELIVGILAGVEFRPDNSIPLNPIPPVSFGEYTFQTERYEQAIPELAKLHKLHWLETEKHRHGIMQDMDYPLYCQTDRDGRLVLFTIRKNGELVGQSTMKIHVSMHTKTLVSDEDSLFLREDCRGGRTIFKFIDFMDQTLTALGVKEVRVSSKMVNSADKLMMRCGFKPFATQLIKLLGVPDETQTQV